MDNSEVNAFNTSVLVQEEYGRSVALPSIYYVTPDEQIYNFQSYARNYNFLNLKHNFLNFLLYDIFIKKKRN